VFDLIKKYYNYFFNKEEFYRYKTDIKDITVGHRDKNGFADVYIDGKKSNTRLLLFDKKRAEELLKISENIHLGIDRKRKIEKIKNNINETK
jgi:hypothetical protein